MTASELFSTRRVFVLLVFLGILFVSAREIMDRDFWWHLRTGQLIVQTHGIPHVDPYSWTKAGQPWVTHEWLAEVLLYGAFRAFGFGGLIVLGSLVVVAALAFAYARAPGKPFVAGFALLLGALATALNWGVRLQMITFLLASIWLWLLDDFLLRGGRRVWLLVPLMVLWINLHGGFALGPALLVLYALGLLTEAILERESWREAKPRLRVVAGLFVACMAVVPLNPSGVRLYLYPFETVMSRAQQAYIPEWQSPDFHNPGFQMLAILLFATFAALALSPKRARARELIVTAALGYAALRSVRHIPLFAVVAIPVLAEHALAWLAGFRRTAGLARPMPPPNRPKLVLNAVIVLAAIAAVGLRFAEVIGNQPAWEREEFPAIAVEYISLHRPPAPLFNPYGWGGYLIWRLHPQYPVYIDGRADMYGDAHLEQYFKAARGEIDGIAVLESHGVRTAIVQREMPLDTELRNACEWERVFEDTKSAIFVRR